MGYGKHKRRVRDSIADWNCFGYFGYGQGRSAAEYGAEALRSKSTCRDICSRTESCRMIHHGRMDREYPMLAALVRNAAKAAKVRGRDTVESVVAVLNAAVENETPEALDVKKRLEKFRVDTMADHYRCGQFENIDDGINRRKPGARCG